MEQGRLILAIALSIAVFLFWEMVFDKHNDVKQQEKIPRATKLEEKTEQRPAIEIQKPPVAASDHFSSPVGDASGAVKQPRIITVRTPRYAVKISEAGASFTSFVLADYKERVEENSPLKELIPKDIAGRIIGCDFSRNRLPQNARFVASEPGDFIDVAGGSRTLLFSWKSPEGILIEKQFSFSSDTYLIGLAVTVKNSGAGVFEDELIVSLFGKAPVNSNTYGFEGPSALIDNHLHQIKTKKIKEKDLYSGSLQWIAVEDRYFISSIIPENTETGRMHLEMSGDTLASHLVKPMPPIEPGAYSVSKFNLFFGPKSLKILSRLANDLDRSINFGWFDFIAKPCLWFMNFLHGFIPNYGVAIIILTLVTKLLLWPLGNKSYKSMNEMKKIQPLMAEVREKYPNDKKKMNEELMKLYRVYKINPMGGCLPMVVQIPVFFALYRMLYEAIELRHAPFMLWINDLSAPDRLFRFDFSIPFMQPPYGIPVLTLVMGATMLIQQKMSPPPGDPGQAKMMMLMPIIFTFIFINFSSGLVLYWLVNNVLSIAQQYYIIKKTA